MNLTVKHAWVIEALRRSQGRGLSLAELNDRWKADEDLSDGKELPRQTFARWITEIRREQGIVIKCDRKDENRYKIDNPDALEKGNVSNFMLEVFATANTLRDAKEVKDRVLTERTPYVGNLLPTFVSAMKENRMLKIEYKKFGEQQARTRFFSPFFLKRFRQRWYALGTWDANEAKEMKDVKDGHLYCLGLERMNSVELTDKYFVLPTDLSAADYMAPFYGVVLAEDTTPQVIKIRCSAEDVGYIDTVPLHSTQRKVEVLEDGSAIYTMQLNPQIDFRQELLAHGAQITVLEPASLREQMRQTIEQMLENYLVGSK